MRIASPDLQFKQLIDSNMASKGKPQPWRAASGPGFGNATAGPGPGYATASASGYAAGVHGHAANVHGHGADDPATRLERDYQQWLHEKGTDTMEDAATRPWTKEEKELVALRHRHHQEWLAAPCPIPGCKCLQPGNRWSKKGSWSPRTRAEVFEHAKLVASLMRPMWGRQWREANKKDLGAASPWDNPHSGFCQANPDLRLCGDAPSHDPDSGPAPDLRLCDDAPSPSAWMCRKWRCKLPVHDGCSLKAMGYCEQHCNTVRCGIAPRPAPPRPAPQHVPPPGPAPGPAPGAAAASSSSLQVYQ